MRDKKKRDRNAAEVENRSELKYFAQRNKVSMEEARILMAQFGDPRPTGGRRLPKSTSGSKAARTTSRIGEGTLARRCGSE